MDQSSVKLEENKEEKSKVSSNYVNHSINEKFEPSFDLNRYSTYKRLHWVVKNAIKFIKKIRKQRKPLTI